MNSLVSYTDFLNEIKSEIKSAQQKAILSVNKELISLYWFIGKQISLNQKQSGWGSKIVSNLAKDIKNELNSVDKKNIIR